MDSIKKCIDLLDRAIEADSYMPAECRETVCTTLVRRGDVALLVHGSAQNLKPLVHAMFESRPELFSVFDEVMHERFRKPEW